MPSKEFLDRLRALVKELTGALTVADDALYRLEPNKAAHQIVAAALAKARKVAP